MLLHYKFRILSCYKPECHVISQVPVKQQEATLSALLGMSLIFYFITNVKSDLADIRKVA